VAAEVKPIDIRHSVRAPDAVAGELSDSGGYPAHSVLLLDGRRISVARGLLLNDRIALVAGSQRGRVARRQLLAIGVCDSAIGRRLRAGWLEREGSGVYGLRHTSELPLAAETAALLASGEGATLSHHSAATLWELRPGIARPIHVTIPAGRSGPTPRQTIVHRSRTLIPTDVRIHQSLPVTSPARTLLDVAATLPDRDIERLLDEALFARRMVTVAQVVDVLNRAGGHPGRARLERVVGNHTSSTKTDSPPEEKLLALIRAAGLPEPELQVDVLGYRLDFFWPDLRLAVEVDAYGTHGSPARFEADRRRDARLLTDAAIMVLRFTRAAIEQRPYEVIGVLARAIGQREAGRDTIPAVRGRW
jgi:very-short-patch-repair endonuclease